MTVERLTRDDRTEAARVLIDSFHDYPYMRMVLRDSGADYDADLEALVLFILDARWARRHPVLGLRGSSGLEAVATVVDPGPAKPSREVERLFEALGARLGDGPDGRMSAYEEAAHEGRPEEPFHYLGMLGVASGRQGHGLGGRLLHAVKQLAIDDERSTGICLNTETAANVALYEHLGFEVVGEADIEDLHTWCMFWRSPGPR